MRILTIVDKEHSAIDILSQDVKKYAPHHKIDIVAVHPKKPEMKDLITFEELAKDADILDFQYYKTALMLLEKYPQFKDKKKILTHHNPYSLLESDWSQFDKVVVMNDTQKQILPDAEMIRHSVDLNKFKWNFNYENVPKHILMVAARIESKKGILPVAKVCKKLGYKFVLVGKISDPNYFDEIQKANPDMEFLNNIPEEDLLKVYYNSMVLVCNSVDNFESGTLPILEAMAVGIPVLTRPVGYIPDVAENNKNMVVRYGSPEDEAGIEKELKTLVEHQNKRFMIRENAFNLVRGMNAEKRSRLYSQLYYKLRSPEPLTSVILSTFERLDILKKCLKYLNEQTYDNFEVIIADDGSLDETCKWVLKNRYNYKFPIKYVNTFNHDSYGLAKGRNLALIEAEGENVILFQDRFKADKDMVHEFSNNCEPGIWTFADKGAQKKSFTEGVSCAKRRDMIDGGMFCERINSYGGMTQEVTKRFLQQGISFIYLPEAKCEPLYNTRSSKYKDSIYRQKLRLWKMGF